MLRQEKAHLGGGRRIAEQSGIGQQALPVKALDHCERAPDSSQPPPRSGRSRTSTKVRSTLVTRIGTVAPANSR